MTKERYNQIIDEAYKNYIKETDKLDLWKKENSNFIVVTGPVYNAIPRQFTKEEFISKIETNKEFSERCGLKINERELSLEERYDLIEKNKHTQFVTWQSHGTNRIKEVLDEKEVPTKLITVTYNGEIIESYNN